jgi:hypothetical protein
MNWEREPLWAKAKLFFDRAFEERREDPLFGLWCSLGLELLARAAVASVNPALLADPDPDQKNLLYALKLTSDSSSTKSLTTARVLNLCRFLFPKFTEDDRKVAVALANRRNEELHSGGAGFTTYPVGEWLVGFYRASWALTDSMGETLESLFGKAEAGVANEVLSQNEAAVKSRVLKLIAEFTKLFAAKTPEEQEKASQLAKVEGEQLSHKRHHRVTCPACKSVATVQGDAFGPEKVIHGDGEIVVRQAVSPRLFSCPACGLKLQGYAELGVAGVGAHYTRASTFSPDEYYGLINPDDTESLAPYLEGYMERHMDKYVADLHADTEYDND